MTAKGIVALKESVRIYKQIGTNHAGTAKALGYLGVVYREQSELHSARELLEESVRMYDEYHYPKYSSVYAGALAHLGIAYRMLGEFVQAREYLQKSFDIYKEIRPESHPDIDRNILNLGIIDGELGDFGSSKTLLYQSLANYEKNYGVSHIETGKVLNHLGRAYIACTNDESEQAEQHLDRAFAVLNAKNHPESYRSLELLGDLYVKKATSQSADICKRKAAVFFQQSLELAGRYFPSDSDIIKRIKSKLCNGS